MILINRIINADLKLRHAWKKKYWSLAYGGRNIKFGNSRPESTYQFIALQKNQSFWK